MTKSTNIWNRLLEVLEVDNLDEAAQKLDINASTLRGRKARGAIPYEKIVHNLNAEQMAYVFKNEHVQNMNKISEPENIEDIESKRPSILYPDDPVAAEFERRIDGIVYTIENGPFSRGLKLRLVKSLLRIVREERAELRKQSDPNQPVSDDS